mmetsp:Transcript_76897/g.213652  ORF Transcript_76897/g.213652 Transcript_76897/m.213652 type:complete len:395 (-) Transcript_76897:13-1197(-)
MSCASHSLRLTSRGDVLSALALSGVRPFFVWLAPSSAPELQPDTLFWMLAHESECTESFSPPSDSSFTTRDSRPRNSLSRTEKRASNASDSRRSKADFMASISKRTHASMLDATPSALGVRSRPRARARIGTPPSKAAPMPRCGARAPPPGELPLPAEPTCAWPHAHPAPPVDGKPQLDCRITGSLATPASSSSAANGAVSSDTDGGRNGSPLLQRPRTVLQREPGLCAAPRQLTGGLPATSVAMLEPSCSRVVVALSRNAASQSASVKYASYSCSGCHPSAVPGEGEVRAVVAAIAITAAVGVVGCGEEVPFLACTAPGVGTSSRSPRRIGWAGTATSGSVLQHCPPKAFRLLCRPGLFGVRFSCMRGKGGSPSGREDGGRKSAWCGNEYLHA